MAGLGTIALAFLLAGDASKDCDFEVSLPAHGRGPMGTLRIMQPIRAEFRLCFSRDLRTKRRAIKSTDGRLRYHATAVNLPASEELSRFNVGETAVLVSLRAGESVELWPDSCSNWDLWPPSQAGRCAEDHVCGAGYVLDDEDTDSCEGQGYCLKTGRYRVTGAPGTPFEFSTLEYGETRTATLPTGGVSEWIEGVYQHCQKPVLMIGDKTYVLVLGRGESWELTLTGTEVHGVRLPAGP